MWPEFTNFLVLNVNYSTKETHIWLPWHIILILGIATHNYLVPNCSAINWEYITRNMVKIKQLCLSIGSARYRGGMVPKAALSYHWITLVKTLILDYTLILLPQYINNGWDHHRQQYILHSAHLRRMLWIRRWIWFCGNLSHSSNRNLRRSARVLSTFRRVWTALPNWSQACSIGFKSGEQAGQSTLVICSCCRYASTILARWGRALWSWNNALAPCSGRKEQPLVAISRRYSDGNLSCRQRSPDPSFHVLLFRPKPWFRHQNVHTNCFCWWP